MQNSGEKGAVDTLIDDRISSSVPRLFFLKFPGITRPRSKTGFLAVDNRSVIYI